MSRSPHPPRRPAQRAGTLVGALVTVLALAAGACSSTGASPGASTGDGARTGSESESGTDPGTSVAVGGEVALFDPEVVHQLDITFDEADFDQMVDTYQSTGEKTWIEATVTVDGTTYRQAGVRLKGNSSLRGASQSTPQDLPWLIRLDRFVDGQTHQSYEDIVVRSNTSATSLNEAVALDLLEAAGLASMAAAPARFSANGSDAVLRLIVEHPDDDHWYETSFDGPGALYKAESTGDWSYRGDDPAAYDEVFDQEGGKDVTDLTPLIELLRFIDEADDETFATELPQRLDVEAFATYLAMMDLVENFDDIDGPGNNAYLWWDAAGEQFTVVPWDLNAAFSTSPAAGPGGGGRPDGPGGFPGRPDGELPWPDGELPGRPDGELPWPDGEPPTRPDGAGGGGRPEAGVAGQGRGPGGGFNRSNPLVERFHADEDFEALYQQQLEQLRTALFDSELAAQILAARTQVLLDQASDLVDQATIRSESEAIAGSIS